MKDLFWEMWLGQLYKTSFMKLFFIYIYILVAPSDAEKLMSVSFNTGGLENMTFKETKC